MKDRHRYILEIVQSNNSWVYYFGSDNLATVEAISRGLRRTCRIREGGKVIHEITFSNQLTR